MKALEDKMERYHALLEAVGDDEELKTDIEVILGRASAMLRLARLADARSRAAAGAASRPRPPPAPAPRPTPPAARPRPGPAGAPAAGPRPPRRPRAASRRSGRAAGPGPAGSGRLPGQRAVEHLLMEARGAHDGVGLRQRGQDLRAARGPGARRCPAYHVRLAIAMACYPSTAKQAEREFLEALRLEPDNADIHYQFGLYYKVMRQRARALGEMQTAVRLNPRHRAAREELEALLAQGLRPQEPEEALPLTARAARRPRPAAISAEAATVAQSRPRRR